MSESDKFVVINGTKKARRVTQDLGDGVVLSVDYSDKKVYSRDADVRDADEGEVTEYYTRREAMLLAKRDKMKTELLAVERELSRIANFAAATEESDEEEEGQVEA